MQRTHVEYHEAASQGASYDYRTLRVSGRISSARACVCGYVHPCRRFGVCVCAQDFFTFIYELKEEDRERETDFS